MCYRNSDPKHNLLIRLGLFFLVIGALSLRLLPACPGLTPDLADGMSGLFYGLAIGCMLVGLRSRCRDAAIGDGGPR